MKEFNDTNQAIQVHLRPGGVILHPTDFSKASQRAFELASQLARDHGSRLVVLHVAEPPWVAPLDMLIPPPLPEGYRGAWENRLRRLRPADPRLPVEYRLEEGDIADSIVQVAEETQSDLIVMAGRQRNWLERLLTSSISAEVERRAACPVLRLDLSRKGDGVVIGASAGPPGTDGADSDRGPDHRASDRVLTLRR